MIHSIGALGCSAWQRDRAVRTALSLYSLRHRPIRERDCRSLMLDAVRIATPVWKIALCTSAADKIGGASAPVALATELYVSVSGGVTVTPCNVSSPLPAALCLFFWRWRRTRSALLSLSYWRRFQAATWEPVSNPIVRKASTSASTTERGSHRAAAMRRVGMSTRPPSFTAAAFSSIRCQEATATEREQSATIAASASLGSVTVPS